MFSDLFHRFIYYSAVLTVVATVWVSAWSKALMEEANIGTWPPLQPHLEMVSHSAAPAVMP